MKDGSTTATRFLFLSLIVMIIAARIPLLWRLPVVWQDEVQFADYYRVFSGGNLSWGVTCHSDGTAFRGTWLWGNFYQAIILGPFGISLVTVRLLGILSGILLVVSAFHWFRSYDVPSGYAKWLALALLLEPSLFQSTSFARLDAAAMAVGLLSLTLWQRSAGRRAPLLSALAGWLAIVAVAIWPTVFVFAVVAVFDSFSIWKADRRSFYWNLMFFFAGALACLLFTVAVICWNMGWETFLAEQSLLIPAARQEGEARRVAIFFRDSPGCVLLLALAGLSVSRTPIKALLLVLPGLLSFGIILLLPPVYLYRLIYILPAVYRAFWPSLSIEPRWKRELIGLVLVANLSLGCVYFYGKTLYTWNEVDYEPYARFLELIPRKAVVQSHEWKPYYVALDRDWEFHMFFIGAVADEEVLDSFEYVIVRSSNAEDLPQYMIERDFELISEIDMTKRTDYGYRAAVYRRKK